MEKDKDKRKQRKPPYGFELVLKRCEICDKLVLLHPNKIACKECVEGLAENFAKES